MQKYIFTCLLLVTAVSASAQVGKSCPSGTVPFMKGGAMVGCSKIDTGRKSTNSKGYEKVGFEDVGTIKSMATIKKTKGVNTSKEKDTGSNASE